jgi:hypothetical protein
LGLVALIANLVSMETLIWSMIGAITSETLPRLLLVLASSDFVDFLMLIPCLESFTFIWGFE